MLTIVLVCLEDQFRSEGRADVLAILCGVLLNHLGDGTTILRVKIGVDFVKEVEGSGIAVLNSKDKAESAWMDVSLGFRLAGGKETYKAISDHH